MDAALSDRLLGYLRGKRGAGVAFAEAPELLTGGFDTTTMAFRLAGRLAASSETQACGYGSDVRRSCPKRRPSR